MEAEMFLFILALGMGMVLLLVYRGLSVIRCFVPERIAAALDLLYWFFAGSAAFAEIYRYNDGILRLFLLPAVFLGAFLMNSLLKRLLFLAKRGRILIIMKNRFCNLKRGRQIEKVQKKEKKHKNIK